MNFDLFFSAASILAMAGWLMLLASPFAPTWSDTIAGMFIPMMLSVGYVVLLIFFSPPSDGGYGSLTDVGKLFSQQEIILAAWIHFLAFDLLIGAWICRTARREGLKFWLVIPTLVLTFLFGPAGFIAFSLVRYSVRTIVSSLEPERATPVGK